MEGRDPMQTPNRARTKLTYDDFLLFPEDGRRHELIDGEHYVSASPILRHQQISMRLTEALLLWLRDHPFGQIFNVPVDLVLSDVDVLVPDLIYVSRERAGILQDPVRSAPDLVVEILSPSTRKRDEQLKRHVYDRSGVREYWIVDPDLEAIRIHRRTGDSFPRVAELSREANDVLTTPLLPGFELPLDAIFETA
jgi:Uma2 family endonuclease